MKRPATLNSRPSFILAVLGGVVATLLFTALLYLSAAAGLAFLDLPALIGGVFADEPRVAFGLGYPLFFLVGALLSPLLLTAAWSALPGWPVGFGGAFLKGVLWALLVWLATGLLLPLLELLNHPDRTQEVGFFAIEAGWDAAAVLLGSFLAYGITLALIAGMGQGIHPVNTLGWQNYKHAETDLTALAAFRERGRLSGSKT